MKYTLDAHYAFCGWEGLPFALMDKRRKDSLFMNREQFKLLWSCDSYTDIDTDSLQDGERSFLSRLQKSGIVHEAERGARLQLHSYKGYPCRYRKDVQLSITGKCNYRCLHCFQSAPHGVLGQPTTQEVIDELDQMVECGIFSLSLTGGEPLIHEGFWDIVDHIIENDMQLSTIYSNGALVNQALLDGFKARNIKPSWSISFDGLGCHDHVRGVPGAEQAAIDAIKLLVANDYAVGCAYTLTKRSAEVFRETVNYLASLGVHSVKSGATMPQGEWLDNPEEWLTDKDYLNFYCEYIPQYLADGRPLNVQFEGLFAGETDEAFERRIAQKAERYGQNEEAEQPVQTEQMLPYRFMHDRSVPEDAFSKRLTCGVLRNSFYIGPTGRVVPCMGIDGTAAGEKFPSLRDIPLREILSTGSYFIDATEATMLDVFEHNRAECDGCAWRSNCGSGCRASAVGPDNDDYLTCDKRTCLTCKEDWTGKIKAAIAAAGLQEAANI